MIEEAQSFLALLEGPPAALTDLALALDRLALAVHALPEGDVEDEDAKRPKPEIDEYQFSGQGRRPYFLN